MRNLPDQQYAGTAHNTGIKHATGTWLLVCDSDDIVYAYTLNILMDTIKTITDTHEQPQAWFGPITSFHADTHQIEKRHIDTNRVLEHAQKTGDIGRLAHHYSPCGKIIKRDFIENTPSDSEPGRLAKMPFFLPQPQQVVEHGFINPKSTGFHPVHYDDGWNVWIPPTKDNDKDNGSNTKP